MNYLKRHITFCLATGILLVFMLAGCVSDDMKPFHDYKYLTIRLQLASGLSTRADAPAHSEHPEDSDKDNTEGLIEASVLESEINDITFFFLMADASGKDSQLSEYDLSQLDLPIAASLYLDLADPSSWGEATVEDSPGKTIKIRIPEGKTIPDTYYLLAVANMGDLSSTFSSLHEIRAHVASKAWDVYDKGSVLRNNFAMSSFLKSEVSPKGGVVSPISGLESGDFSAQCHLMRLAARIDLGCSRRNDGNGETADSRYGMIVSDGEVTEVQYTAYDKATPSEGSRIGTLFLQNIELTNRKTSPSFTLRHTVGSADVSGLVSNELHKQLICGGVMSRSNFVEQTYVADPNFLDKTPSAEASLISSLYSNRHKSVWHAIEDPASGASSGIIPFSDAATSPASFIENKTDAADCEAGFNRTLTIGYVNENTFPYPAGISTSDIERLDENFATGLIIKTVFVPDVVLAIAPAGSGPEADAAGSYIPEGFTTVEISKGETFFMWKGTEGGESKALFFNSKEAADKFNASCPGVVKGYPGGVGFHELLIEHADRKAPAGSPLKHAVIRNNVYRVLLQFTGPGKTFMEEEQDDMSWKIYTRPWNVRWQPEIII